MNDEKWSELHELLSTMQVPIRRTSDVFWLDRNLASQNKNHPDFPKAMELIKVLAKDIRKAINKASK